MFQPIDISSAQVSGVDDLGPATSSVINWETDETGINRPRAGLATHTVTNIPSSPAIGLERWKTYTVVVADNRRLYAIRDEVPDTALTLSTATATTQCQGAERPTFATGDSYIYATGGNRVVRWKNADLTASTLTSSPNCTHIAILGQRLVANDVGNPQVFRWTDIGEGVFDTWPAANNSNADARPDDIVGLFENVNELFVFGENTLQVYGIGADPTLPFELASTINTGLGAPYCAVRLDENFAFLDHMRRIVISDGRSINPISDAIAKDLRSLDTVSDSFAYREEIGQHSKLVFRFPTEQRTFVYDLKGQKWIGERKYYSAPFQVDYPVGAHVYRPSDNAHIVGSSLNAGGLYKLDTSSRQDIGGALVCERTTGWLDYGTPNRKCSGRIRVIMRRGTSTEGATPGALEIRRQCDHGPWSTWQQVSMGTPSQYEQVQDIFIGRIFRRCRYQLRYSNADNISIVGMYDDITPISDGAEAAVV